VWNILDLFDLKYKLEKFELLLFLNKAIKELYINLGPLNLTI